MSYHNTALETYNYYNDRRVQNGFREKWYKSFDKKNMIVKVQIYDEDYEEEVTFPVHFSVCPECQGHGRMVNPSIDAGGISQEEFYDDPDFAEAYLSKVYDIDCSYCKGEKVVPEITISGMSEDMKRKVELLREQQADQEACLAEMMAERRMGA
jgi:hypothetical protein